MATKRASRPKPKDKPRSTLQNLAARPQVDDAEDEQLVDHSGVFRVTTNISRNQIGHDDDSAPRFASDSLVIAAQREGFREDGPTIDEAVEEHTVDDAVQQAEKKQRLRTLAALARNRKR